MKKIFILSFYMIIYSAWANSPITTCPSDYLSVEDSLNVKSVLIADTCPPNYVSAGTITSCLVSSAAGDCWMYVPVGTTYTDAYGSYQYTEICPLQ